MKFSSTLANLIILKTLLLVTLTCILCNCSSDLNELEEEIKEKDTVEIKEDVIIRTSDKYGSKSLQNLDVIYKTNKSNCPILIYIHGGGWFEGDKSNFNDSLSNFFIEKGFVCFSVNYPLSPFPYNLKKGQIRHPEHINNVNKAYTWIKNNATKFGGDTTNIIVMGHSAGSHLATMLLYDLDNSKDIGKQNIKKIILLDSGTYLIGTDFLEENLHVKNMIINALGYESINSKNLFFPVNNTLNCSKDIEFVLIHSSDSYRIHCMDKFIQYLENHNLRYNDYILTNYKHEQVLSDIPHYWDSLGLSH